ncbi:hypothetical protein [Methylophilus medardicus]|uniref:Uncharacterized protein n=1 Tax=Methylophilus medardicus TaxID=2588534 RepID=A0A5B8CR10_9PROT|nr:hypothetical protein [Methylophilus medardicus]QDC43520.1 hypothetical protein FIU01_02565 [Methylophilus medardicus]QDC48527.1 hypothetical protein FIU00_02565 [Methylophilus medardicus]QDC52232.1 hypothetical protein FIT99_02565 [Methylophilus medardicus]
MNTLPLHAIGVDPNLPDAESVMASLLYVATLYIKKPSHDLARQALQLAETLMLPEYAESDLICRVSRRLCVQWTLLVNEHAQLTPVADNIKTTK